MKLSLSLVVCLALLCGCKKKFYGCVDDYAINFEPSATDYDESCLYSYDVGFYLSQNQSEFLDSINCTIYSVFIDGQYIGSDSTSHFYPKYSKIHFIDTLGARFVKFEIVCKTEDSTEIYSYRESLQAAKYFKPINNGSN